MSDLLYSNSKPAPPEAIQRLFAQTDWASKRSVEQIASMMAGTGAWLGVWAGETLVGFGRAVTDGVFRAFVEDVVVDEAWRGHGIGGEIVRRLLDQLAPVEEIALCCHDSLIPFYEKVGFRINAMTHMNIWKGG